MLRFARIVAFGYMAVCLLALAVRALVTPLGYVPFPLVAAPARPPIVATIWYSSEKRSWLEDAKARFEATNPTTGGRPIQIQLVSMGSREMAQRAAQQNWQGAPPAALSPASGFWLEQAGVPIAGTPQPLALSPLVVVGWAERAQVLWPSGPRDLWRDLHDAVANTGGWQALGGNANWGPVKLGQASPDVSNSGAQALMLLAYSFHNKASGLSTADVNDPQFVQWFNEFENGVPGFATGTDQMMNDMVRFGPAKYDFAIAYENLALQNMKTSQNQLRIFYPPTTMLSDHPFALLQNDGVAPEARAAAEQFRDFLLSTPMQELALQYGFRPVNQSVSIAASGANNPFTTYADSGVQASIAGLAEAPSADATNALLELWRRQFGQ